MKIIHTISLALALGVSAGTATAGPLDQQADSAYSADRFEEAAELYRKANTEYGSDSGHRPNCITISAIPIIGSDLPAKL